MGVLSKRDWEEIKNKYIFGFEKEGKLHFPSFNELSDMYSVSVTAIIKHAKKQQWTEQREILKNKILDNINIKKEEIKIEDVAEQVSDEIVNFDLKCLNIAKEGINICIGQLKNLTNIEDKIPSYELEKISSALEKFQKVGKNAIGEALPNNNIINIDIIDDNNI